MEGPLRPPHPPPGLHPGLVLLAAMAALWAGITAGSLLDSRSAGVQAHHRTHVVEKKLACTACHAGALGSTKAGDLLIPSGSACRPCHPGATCEGPLEEACQSCHEGKPGSLLAERMKHAKKTAIKFDHSSHASTSKIACTKCHPLDPEDPDASDPGLPGMALCISCHPHSDAYASDSCTPCHIKTKKGTLKLDPGGKKLAPPAWMSGALHDGAWVLDHAGAAATRPGLCSACHTDTDCATCHAGKVKPASIHPGDWVSFHPVSAALGDLRCSSCHSYQEFCVTCHRKAGAAWDSPASLGIPSGDVFHPEGWYTLGGQGKHGLEAKKNLATCVSCHTEKDCTMCHSAMSSFSVSPHPPAGLWLVKCKVLAKKNPTTCLKCHASVPCK